MNLKSKLILITTSLVVCMTFEACDKDKLEVDPKLVSKFEFNKTTLNSEVETIFHDVSSGNVTDRKWIFTGANISISSEISPEITFMDYGQVEVGLIVHDADNNESDTSFQNLNVFPGKGLVAYFPIDSMAFDESGNEFHGIITGTQMYEDVNGGSNSARAFDGYTDYITSSSKISELLNEGATFAAWIKPLDTIDTGDIVSNIASGSATNNAASPTSNGAGFRLTFGTYDYRGVGFSYSASDDDKVFWKSEENQQITINEWGHVLGTWNGDAVITDALIDVYINSIRANSAGGMAFPNNHDSYVNSKDSLIIGSKYLRSEFNCVIDEVRIYNRPLSLDEIQFLQKYRQ